MSKRENSATLYLYVKEYIMKLLISGKYPPNSQLPTEYQFMQELDVGRATVRAALSQLEREGIVYKKQGVGTFVSKREKNFGLEPLVSFSFMIKNMGFHNTNEILDSNIVIVDNKELSKYWETGSEVYKIKRLRFAEQTPLAIENRYYSPNVYQKLDKEHLADSLTHNFLSNIGTPINKIETKTIVREPTLEECKKLVIPVTEEVIQVTRWIYLKDDEDKPVCFVDFVMPTHVLDFPFLS